jgi:Ser/Thr protein kinase RdoA (MazF antagonist)
MYLSLQSVSRFIADREKDSRRVLTLVPTLEGDSWCMDDNGEHWRVYNFIEGGICLQAPETPEDFYESAVGFGTFMEQMSGFPAENLIETIKDFHNTIDRYMKFKDALKKDSFNRVREAEREIEFILSREEEAGLLHRMRLKGELPLRVTHNDTKLNNVMLDKATRKALCVLDLDTVMPGLSLYDFGDSIRFGAATAPEDERDLSKMKLNLELFRIYTRGYTKACPSLTEKERQLLPLGAKTITLEQGVRFLTDYLEGDHYFGAQREKHNLDRARAQLRLVEDMESKWEDMNAIVMEEAF